MQRPPGVYLNLGNLLEALGAFCACWGVDRLVGFSWALILAAVLMVVAAELIYDQTTVRAVPLPQRMPRPRAYVSQCAASVRRRLVYGRWGTLVLKLRVLRVCHRLRGLARSGT